MDINRNWYMDLYWIYTGNSNYNWIIPGFPVIIKMEKEFNLTKEKKEALKKAKKIKESSDCSDYYDCFDCYDCSDCSDCLDCSYCSHCSNCSDCYDCSYCSHCSYCSYCSDKKYMICNVQFTKDEYEAWIEG